MRQNQGLDSLTMKPGEGSLAPRERQTQLTAHEERTLPGAMAAPSLHGDTQPSAVTAGERDTLAGVDGASIG